MYCKYEAAEDAWWDDVQTYTERPHLARSGYLTEDYVEWFKTITTYHTARRDHADGTVKAGDHYKRVVDITIDDATGARRLDVEKYVIRSAQAVAA